MDLSVVLPCLNEEETLEGCISDIRAAMADTDIDFEILIADNGSTDRSAEIAESLADRVVSIPEKGYGRALAGGFDDAQGTYIVFADCDGSCRMELIPQLYDKAVSEDADMVIASRVRGDLEPGAMPFLHRYVGNPVLTGMINILFGGKLSDCNSGYRCVRKAAWEKWNIRSKGMEFVSELQIKALKNDCRIMEVPAGLDRDKRSRPPHLRTWRDGMRHLLLILSERPGLMETVGIAVIALSSVLQLVMLAVGPVGLSEFSIFDYHSHALTLLAGCLGVQSYLLGCYLYLPEGADRPLRITKWVLEMDEAVLFFMVTVNIIACLTGTAAVFTAAFTRGSIDIINPFLVALHFLFTAGFLSIGLLGIHIVKRTR